jgi:1-aminocyclopropane-1-carboxylate deaminase
LDLSFPKEENSIIIELFSSLFIEKRVRLFVKREDLMHPYISGNKLRKLKYNLIAAKEAKLNTLLTFGGAYSNHIYATAAAGKLYGFETIGIIRGEKIEPFNATLQFASDCDMKLKFLSRGKYREKETLEFIAELNSKFGDFYLLPEGGTNNLAIKGCCEILQPEEYDHYNYICCSCGTGGTITGILSACNYKANILGFSVLKGDFMENEVLKLYNDFNDNLQQKKPNFTMLNDYHFGGYAKSNPDLEGFIDNFITEYKIPIEHVYTAKMFYGIFDLIKQDYFPENSKILAIHTGGLRI